MTFRVVPAGNAGCWTRPGPAALAGGERVTVEPACRPPARRRPAGPPPCWAPPACSPPPCRAPPGLLAVAPAGRHPCSWPAPCPAVPPCPAWESMRPTPQRVPARRLLLDLDLLDHTLRSRLASPEPPTARPASPSGPAMNFLVVAGGRGWPLAGGPSSRPTASRPSAGSTQRRSGWTPGEGPAARHRRSAGEQRDFFFVPRFSLRDMRLLKEDGERTPLYATRYRTGFAPAIAGSSAVTCPWRLE